MDGLDQYKARIGDLEEEVESLRAENAKLKLDNAKLKLDLSKLKDQFEEKERSRKRQAAPFRRRKHVEKPKKSGRKKGHPPANRSVPEHVDRELDAPIPVENCPDCDVPFEVRIEDQYQIDIPPIEPTVTRFDIRVGICPCCGKRIQGRHEEQTSDALGAAKVQLGPSVLAMAVELKHWAGMPYRKISEFIERYFHCRFTHSAFCRAEQRLADLARPTYELLVDALRRCGVVHADETGWRISRAGAWMWVFTSKNVTIYAIRTSRGSDVPTEILGSDFDGVLIVDGWSAYDVLECRKGRCNGHILRRAQELAERSDKNNARYLRILISLIQEAIELAGRRDEFTELGYKRKVANIKKRFADWLTFHGYQPSEELQRLVRHLRDHEEEWFRFLDDPEVPPTNNPAEQMVRPGVILRKIGACNKTLMGALVHETLTSILVSCKQQLRSFRAFIEYILRSPEPGPVDLAGLPPG